MALIVKDRVRETTTTTGTGTITLIAPVSGFQSFSVIGNGNTTYYCIVDVATGAWEVGIGTYTSSGTTLSRDTVLESSNAGALVSFGSGTKDVFCTYPADRSVSQADVGTDPNEIPLNQYLGSMAYQDRTAVNIGGGTAVIDTLTADSISLRQDTDISNIAPSLSLDFVKSGTLDPRITYTRASTATYYNGVTTAVAEQNLLLQSQTFDNASWDKLGSAVTANAAVAPDGTSTAELLVGTTGSTNSLLRQQPAIPTGGTDVLTVYAKYLNYQYVILNMRTGVSERRCWFDVLNGVVGTNSSGGTASIQDVGNGWYRLILSRANEGGTLRANFQLATTDGVLTITGDDVSGNYLWGSQFEKRDQATAYTVTTTQPITNYIPVLLTAASDVPRFDHNPISQESLGLLIEEQRTNLVLRSEELNVSPWTQTSVTVSANQIIAPDGTLTGDKIISTSGNIGTIRQSSITVTNGAPYTLSCIAKAGEHNSLVIFITDGVTARVATLNLLTGVVSDVSSGLTTTVTQLGNGWYRFSGSVASSGSTSISLRLGSTQTGDGYSGIFIWGAQLEAGAFATSYIATVASQVTRAADAANMTGTNFSSWYSQGEGTLYVESLTQNTAAANPKNLRLSDGTTSNEIWLGGGSPGTSARSQIFLGGTTYFDSSLTNQMTAGVFGKYAISFETNNAVLCANGTLGTVDTAVPISSAINQLTIIPPNARAGYYKKISYFPRRLSNAELQEMTS